MKIRRYLGFDCNSYDGFNNGQYIDDEAMEVKDYAKAEELCREALEEYLGRKLGEYDYEDISHGDGPCCLEVITGYYDGDGNEITAEEFDGDNQKHSYRYVYVSAEREE